MDRPSDVPTPPAGVGPEAGAAPDPDGFAALLRAALVEHGDTLEGVRRAMAARGHDLSITTLSYWQNGRSLPTRASSLAALADLERVLHLPLGTLLEGVERDRRPRHRALPVDTISADARRADEINELALDLGLRWDDGLDRLAVHTTLVVDAGGAQRGHTLREIVRARRACERIPAAFYWDHPDLQGRIEARDGCRIGRVRVAPAYQVAVAEVVLSEPLRVDQSHSLDLAFVEPEPGPDDDPSPSITSWEIGFMTSIKVLHRQVRFHPDRVPRHVYAVDPEGAERRLEPVSPTYYSDLLVDTQPGASVLRWEW